MASVEQIAKTFATRFDGLFSSCEVKLDELTVELPLELQLELPGENCREIFFALRDEEPFKFDMLIDICGVDYLHHGLTEWATEETTATGFSRATARDKMIRKKKWNKPRFAVVYHLLSIAHNHRIRLRIFTDGEPPMVDSVMDIWESANWFEREAFDLYGILFNGHPDLRRILTDYGFVGHPFRKDFPLIGEVSMRYDATLGRCVYEPVQIQPRTLVPKVIRDDNRYFD